MTSLQLEPTGVTVEEPLDISLKIPGSAADTASSNGIDNIEDLDRTLSEQFADEIRDLARSKSHRKVAVQLLSWEFEGEGCLNTAEEVRINYQVLYKL